MDQLEKIRKYRDDQNRFAAMLGIVTLEIKEGYARGEMELKPDYDNVVGSVHGGCIFTLADTIGGAAAASGGMKMTTVSSDMHYLSPAIGAEKLTAEAKEIKKGKKISVYDVEISDDKGKRIAKGTFSYYNLGTPLL